MGNVQSLLTTWEQRGSLAIGRAQVMRTDIVNTGGSEISDYAYAEFQTAAFQPGLYSLPGTGALAAGTCAVYPGYPAGRSTYVGLDGGASLMLTGTSGTRQIPPDAYASYQRSLGDSAVTATSLPVF